VTGNDAPVAYTPGEIVPSHEFYDYDAKYVDPDGASLKIPADLGEQMTRRVRQLAVQAYKALDLTGLSRVDFFVDKRNDALYLNEINTIPGFTSISMFPKMCEASGLPYADLVMKLVHLAKARFDARAPCARAGSDDLVLQAPARRERLHPRRLRGPSRPRQGRLSPSGARPR
jgi:D-alanine-D-alanine ligase